MNDDITYEKTLKNIIKKNGFKMREERSMCVKQSMILSHTCYLVIKENNDTTKSFRGIGATIEEAREAAAKLALTRYAKQDVYV